MAFDWKNLRFIGVAVVGLLLLGGAVLIAIRDHQSQQEIVRLRNEAASKDTTLEVQKNLYTKLSLESDNLKGLLDNKDQQVQELLSQVKKGKEDLLAANQLAVNWKKAYEGAAAAHQTEQPPTDPSKPGREKVDFSRNFGLIQVDGFTLTNPAEAWVSVKQTRPLKVTLAISQDKSKEWHAYATTDDDNTTVNISLASVNPYLLEPHWYENLQLNVALAGGQAGTNFGVLAGVGVSYKIGQFDVGPMVFVGINEHVDKYFGATFSWRPFEQKH